MRKICFAIFSLLAVSKIANAQENTERKIDANFQKAGIEQFTSDLSLKTGYTFYYDPAVFDSLKVTLNVTGKPISTILDMAFSNTNFHYTIIKQQVFFTKGRALNPGLPKGLFGDTSAGFDKQAAAIAAYTDENEQKAPDATIENKVYEIGIKTNNIKPGMATISGYLRDIKSGEPVIGASIYNAATKSGVTTDQFGYYTFSLPRGRQTLTIKALSMKDTRRKIILYSSGKLNIELQEEVTTLKEVKISVEKVANVRNAELGINRLDIKSIKQTPTVFGESDVLRVVLTLPGVQSGRRSHYRL